MEEQKNFALFKILKLKTEKFKSWKVKWWNRALVQNFTLFIFIHE